MKWFIKSGFMVALIVSAVIIIGNGGCAYLKGYYDLNHPWFPSETNAPPVVVTNAPADPPPSESGLLSDEEARKLIASKQFLEGADRNSPLALMQFKRFGNRISHVGGGCKPKDPANESALWKPIGDSSPKLVVLLPCHVPTFSAVSIGGERATGMSLGNGWRPTIRFSKPGASYGQNVRLVVEGVGSAIIPNGGARTTFKLSTSAAPVDNAPTDPPAVVDDSETFSWTPMATGIRVRVPKSYKPWKFHVFSLRKHANLYGPVDGNANEWTIPLTGEQLRQASIAANDSGAVMPFVKTSHGINGGGNQAGWRVQDPRQTVTGSATQLRDGEDH